MQDDDQEHTDLRKSLEQLVTSGQVGAEVAQEVEGVLSGQYKLELPAALSSEKSEVSDKEDIRSKIKDLSLAHKIKYAMRGNATCRGLLIGDANRLVQESVLKNPQLTDREVEDYSKNPNVAEFVLRNISAK